MTSNLSAGSVRPAIVLASSRMAVLAVGIAGEEFFCRLVPFPAVIVNKKLPKTPSKMRLLLPPAFLCWFADIDRTITGEKQEKARQSFFQRITQRAIKTPQRCPARVIMRSFGEYAFVKDSRYASQQKSSGLANSPPRLGLRPPAPPGDIPPRARSTESAAGSGRPRSSAAACARRYADNACRADAATPRPP